MRRAGMRCCGTSKRGRRRGRRGYSGEHGGVQQSGPIVRLLGHAAGDFDFEGDGGFAGKPDGDSLSGADYDRIMESTYRALNYLQLGKFDEARVEMNRALDRQRDAVTRNAARIEKAQQAAKDSAANGGYDANRAQQNPHYRAQYQQTYGALDGFKFYSQYVNPFATYLQGLCLMARPQSASDYESARVDFERVRAMIGDDPYIVADCDLATKFDEGWDGAAGVDVCDL